MHQPFSTPAHRLYLQQITQSHFADPRALVAYMGAMQAQDYPMAKWAVGVRVPGLTDAAVEAALDAGHLVRTHVLRPTWHLVAGRDVRWMLALTGQRIKAASASRDRELGIDTALYARTNDLIVKALEGGKHLTREELMLELERGGIETNPSRAVHFMMNAEVDGLVCNGRLRDKTHTYALLDEKVSEVGPTYSREEATAELAWQYFSSHGPATLADFQWWSGLSMPDARQGLEANRSRLETVEMDEKTYFLPQNTSAPAAAEGVHCLPAFDEYCVSYKERNVVFRPEWQAQAITSNGIFKPIIVVNGLVEGIWKRTVAKNKVVVEPTFFGAQPVCSLADLEKSAQVFGQFLGLPVVLKT
jgi:hypothetical protein